MTIDISRLNHQQLTALIDQAEARRHELQSEKVAKLRDKVLAMITSEGLDYADLMDRGVRGRGVPRGKVKQKYRNPTNKSQTWSGRGRHPLWFDAAIKAGKTERSLLIK